MSLQGPYRIEPLADHDRTGFTSGSAELDEYLRERASQDARRRVAAPFVLVDAGRRIAGFYTLSAYAVRVAELPAEQARKLPRYPLIPATLLGRLAVSLELRGQKLGTVLLVDALRRSLMNASEIASVGVVAEAIDDAARGFYLHHEFKPLSGHPLRLFIAMATIRKALSGP